MSEGKNERRDPATNPGSRPLCYLGPNAMPVQATGKRIPAMVTHIAHEGDEEWTPIGSENPR